MADEAAAPRSTPDAAPAAAPADANVVELTREGSSSSQSRNSTLRRASTHGSIGAVIFAEKLSGTRKSTPGSLRMEHSDNNDIGSMSEVMQQAAAARSELKVFADTEVPKKSCFRSAKFGFLVINVRPVVQWLPMEYISLPFTASIIHMGGLERVHLLLAIARFDINGDGMIDDAEYDLARMQGEKFVGNAVNGCANFAIISALLFGATHLSTIGRPRPFTASEESIADFGEDTTTQVMWVLYTLNVLAQSLALGIIVTSIYSRQLLCNTLPSVMSKMVFLAETNLLSNMGAACTWMIASLVYVVVLGGFISVPSCACHAVPPAPLGMRPQPRSSPTPTPT